MVKIYRQYQRTPQTRRYLQLKQKLIELGRRDGEITAAHFAQYVGFSVISGRFWTKKFWTGREIRLSTVRRGGERVYVLTN